MRRVGLGYIEFLAYGWVGGGKVDYGIVCMSGMEMRASWNRGLGEGRGG